MKEWKQNVAAMKEKQLLKLSGIEPWKTLFEAAKSTK